MPGIVRVKVVSARDLPIMDRRSELTDAFVEVGAPNLDEVGLLDMITWGNLHSI